MSFYTTAECIDYIANTIIRPNMNTYTPALLDVFTNEWEVMPRYPSVALVDNKVRRVYSGSHMFTLYIGVQIVVQHAQLGLTPSARTEQDILLARQIILALHADRHLGGNIVQGWVQQDNGGQMTFKDQDTTIKCSFLNWVGEQRELDAT